MLMNTGKTLFAQLMDFLPWTTFTRIVDRYGGDHRVRTLSCAEQYRSLAFAQLTYRESLRDSETCLSVHASKLYHMGFRQPVRRSTLADANERRDWGIVKLTECRLLSAFLHGAKPLKLHKAAIDNLPRFRSESG